ncbi:hypothetical protein [Dyella sedimenti]|nr:hypothetical protein [Dyella sedimenti]
MGEFLAFLAGLLTDYWGQAGQRWAWWALGAIVLVIALMWMVVR